MSTTWRRMPRWISTSRRWIGATALALLPAVVVLASLLHPGCGPADSDRGSDATSSATAAISIAQGHDDHSSSSCHRGDPAAVMLPAVRGVDRHQATPDLPELPAGEPVAGFGPRAWPDLDSCAADSSPSRPVSGRALLIAAQVSRT